MLKAGCRRAADATARGGHDVFAAYVCAAKTWKDSM
jgi:hypothetical protein